MLRRGYDVITVGAATIDAFVWSKGFRTVRGREFATGVGECFSLGSKIDIDRFELTTGGGATNAAATFANLNFRTACLAATGDDLFGAGIRADLAKRGVDASLMQKLHAEQTAFSTILVVPSGERTVLVSRGASEKLAPGRVPWGRVRAKWIYMTSLGGNLAFARAVFRQAAKRGSRVFWNPGSKDLAHGDRLRPLLRGVAVLDLNREEAARLTGKPLGDLRGMIRDLRALCPGMVLITDGEKGAYLAEGKQTWFAKPTGVKAVNRTGAGDSFGSGFLAGFLRYGDRTRALQCATVNAESVIQKIGAKTGVLAHWPTAAALKNVKVSGYRG